MRLPRFFRRRRPPVDPVQLQRAWERMAQARLAIPLDVTTTPVKDE